MFPLPDPIILRRNAFAPLFSPTVWSSTVLLVIGAILSPGKRTVTAALHITGLSNQSLRQVLGFTTDNADNADKIRAIRVIRGQKQHRSVFGEGIVREKVVFNKWHLITPQFLRTN